MRNSQNHNSNAIRNSFFSQDSERIEDMFDGLWWAFITMGTVSIVRDSLLVVCQLSFDIILLT